MNEKAGPDTTHKTMPPTYPHGAAADQPDTLSAETQHELEAVLSLLFIKTQTSLSELWKRYAAVDADARSNSTWIEQFRKIKTTFDDEFVGLLPRITAQHGRPARDALEALRHDLARVFTPIKYLLEVTELSAALRESADQFIDQISSNGMDKARVILRESTGENNKAVPLKEVLAGSIADARKTPTVSSYPEPMITPVIESSFLDALDITDSIPLQNMLQELAWNARKAILSESKGTQIVIRAVISDDHLVITTQDDGPGLRKASGSTKDLGFGSGKGLNIHLAVLKGKYPGATLDLPSYSLNQAGKGYTSTLSIPLAELAQPQVQQEAQ